MRNNTLLNYFNKLKSNGNYSRLFKLFNTDKNLYVYDVGTGKVFNCDRIEYSILENLIKYNDIEKALNSVYFNYSEDVCTSAVNNIIDISQTENLFKAPLVKIFDTTEDEVINGVNHKLEQITLELTEKCNLSCKYCIYQHNNSDFRSFGYKDMDWNIAKLSIDYALAHSDKTIAITFYGGEPLLKIDLIKECVKYALEKNIDNKDIRFSLTTNLTLMTKELAQYFASIPQFSIVCSIDGPEDIHNNNRVFNNGSGSFDKAIIGLNNLIEAYGYDNISKRISLSIVISLPINSQKLYEINNFFEQLSWLPPNLTKNVSYVRESSDKEVKDFSNHSSLRVNNPIGEWTLKFILETKVNSLNKLFINDFFKNTYIKIHDRILTNEPYPKYNLNGCCTPGARKLYITVEGDFYVCERIGISPKIGNIYNGINKEVLVQRYIKDYIKSMEKCSDCWAIRLCSICYARCYDENGLNLAKKEMMCEYQKITLEQQLTSYHSILENNPTILDLFNQISVH